MLIRDQVRLGSRVLIALVAVAVAITGLVLAQVRFGGPMFRDSALQDALLADILPPPAYSVEPFLLVTLIAERPATAATHLARLDVTREEFRTREAFWQEDTGLPPHLHEQMMATLAGADRFWDAVDGQFLPALRAGDHDRLRALQRGDLARLYNQQHAEVLKLVDMSNAYRAEMIAANGRRTAFLLAIAGLLAVVLVAALSFAARRIRRQIVIPLGETASAMRLMAAGDYDVPVCGLDRGDEVGEMAQALEVFRTAGIAQVRTQQDQRQVVDALSTGLERLAGKDLEYRFNEPFPAGYEVVRSNFNRALDALADAFRIVRSGTDRVHNAIGEIRAAAEDLATRNERQAANLEESAAAMNQVTTSVGQTAESARRMQHSVLAADQQAREGGEVVARATGAMADIERSAQQISQIVELIDAISFQTNLLALNAGVEAARAGDAGKGFAVVATEVRALAQRTSTAAEDIRGLIATSAAQVTQGVELVGESGALLGEIAARISDISDLAGTIAEAARGQADALEQVNAAVADMDRMTQANAAMVEQSSAATRSLANEAEDLIKLVSQFRTRQGRDAVPAAGSPLRRQGDAALRARLASAA